jgi:hypothetical protein
MSLIWESKSDKRRFAKKKKKKSTDEFHLSREQRLMEIEGKLDDQMFKKNEKTDVSRDSQ